MRHILLIAPVEVRIDSRERLDRNVEKVYVSSEVRIILGIVSRLLNKLMRRHRSSHLIERLRRRESCPLAHRLNSILPYVVIDHRLRKITIKRGQLRLMREWLSRHVLEKRADILVWLTWDSRGLYRRQARRLKVMSSLFWDWRCVHC